MRGSGFLPLLIAALTPLLIMGLIIFGSSVSLVAWRPPVLWTDALAFDGVKLAADSSGAYVGGYLNYADTANYTSFTGFFFLRKYTPNGMISWTRPILNSSYSITGMSLGKDGVYMIGERSGPSYASVVIKFDITGNLLWTREFGTGSGADAIFASPSGIYVAGQTITGNQSYVRSTLFVNNYDFDGNLLWTNNSTTFDGYVNGVHVSEGYVHGIYVSKFGVYVVGGTIGALTGQTSAGNWDAFIVSYDLSGNSKWSHQFGTPLSDEGTSVSGDATGVYVSGNMAGALYGFLRKYDFQGNLVWSTKIEPPDFTGTGGPNIVADASGIYLFLVTVPGREYLMKYDSNGSQSWSFLVQDHVKLDSYQVVTFNGLAYVSGSIFVPTAGGAFRISALVRVVSTSPSLIFFGYNPPWSFIILGVLLGAAAASIFFFRRLRLGKSKAKSRIVSKSRLPAND